MTVRIRHRERPSSPPAPETPAPAPAPPHPGGYRVTCGEWFKTHGEYRELGRVVRKDEGFEAWQYQDGTYKLLGLYKTDLEATSALPGVPGAAPVRVRRRSAPKK